MERSRPTRSNVARRRLTVLLADDNAAFRRGVREALEPDGFVVVDEAEDTAGALRAAARLEPDICLIELELAGEGGNAIARIVKTSPHTLIVVLSDTARQEDVIGALSRGASGYLLKSGLNARAARLDSPSGSQGRSGALALAHPPPGRRDPSLVDTTHLAAHGAGNAHAARVGGRRAAAGGKVDRGDRSPTRRVTRNRAPARRSPAPEARRGEPRGRGRAHPRLRPPLTSC